jgi:hypothetical protein
LLIGNFLFLCLGCGGGLGFFGRSGFGREFDPFEDRFLGGVALALIQADDAGVAAATIFLAGSDFVEENFYGVFLVEAGGGEAAIMERATLAEGYHFFSDGAGGFGFGQSGGDAFVFDEAANQVREHRVAMGTGAAEFGGAFEVAHKE